MNSTQICFSSLIKLLLLNHRNSCVNQLANIICTLYLPHVKDCNYLMYDHMHVMVLVCYIQHGHQLTMIQ